MLLLLFYYDYCYCEHTYISMQNCGLIWSLRAKTNTLREVYIISKPLNFITPCWHMSQATI